MTIVQGQQSDNMAKFFVSYSRSVKTEVGSVVKLLRASGHEVWWDGDIPIMADWWATILDKIEWCEVFIFVASEKSIISPYCIAELAYGVDRNRPILPFMMDDPTQYTLPPELPHRNQWLLYDGDPAHMLENINTATKNITWEKHQDISAPRPPEPQTGGESLGRQFQEALRLAYDQQFTESKRLLRNIRDLDYGEWGRDCDDWLARLNSYAPITELSDDAHTQERARSAWTVHRQQYGADYDPANIAQKLRGEESTSRRFVLPLAIGFALLIAGAVLLAVALQKPDLYEGAFAPVARNADWTPMERDFDGVTMMLVPVGCFYMGSTDGASDERPVDEKCFDAPFWIDKTEVTVAEFASLNREIVSESSECSDASQSDYPRNCVDWFDAHDFCQSRGARLPTEAEWEYAARGSDGLVYPWGNSFNNLYAITEFYPTGDDYTGGSAPVGSIPEGASWVGALDMIGNLWEWTNSLYQPYPYDATDGREQDTTDITDGERVLRGASWEPYNEGYLRAAFRYPYDPSGDFPYFGFRCARDFD